MNGGAVMVRKIHKKVNCLLCGREISVCINNNEMCICEICKDKNKLIKQEKMIQRGVNLFRKNKISYDKEIEDGQIGELVESIKKKCGNDFFYGSKDEVAIALELALEDIEFEPQKDVGGYRADFSLPYLNVILEIDGEIYHRNKEKEKLTDDSVKNILGDDWGLVRVPCEEVPNCIRFGIENCILAKLEESEYMKNHGYSDDDKFWSCEEYERRRVGSDY